MGLLTGLVWGAYSTSDWFSSELEAEQGQNTKTQQSLSCSSSDLGGPRKCWSGFQAITAGAMDQGSGVV